MSDFALRLRHIVITALATLLILGLASLVLPRLRPVQRWLGSRVAAIVGPALQIDRIRVSFLPVGLRLHSVALVDPSGGVRQPVITSQQIVVDLQLGRLLQGELSAESVHFERPRMVLEQAEDGSFPAGTVINDLFSSNSKTGDGKNPGQSEEALTPMHLLISLSDVEIHIQGAASARPLVVTFDSIEGSVERTGGDPAIAFSFSGDPGESGEIAVDGAYGDRDVPGRLVVNVRVAGVPARALFVEPPGSFERYDVDGEVHGRIEDAVDFRDTLEGSGRLLFSGGTVPAAGLGGVIWSVLLSIVPGVSPDASEWLHERPTEIDHLSANFEVGGGKVALRDIEVVCDDYVVKGKGSIGFDLDLDMRLSVAMTPAGVTKLLVSAKRPLPTGPLKALPPIPMKVFGSIDSPKVRVQIERLPLATAGYVFDATVGVVKGVLEGTGGAAKAAGKRVGELFERD